MSGVPLAQLGWLMALVAGGATLLAWYRLRVRMDLVARADHELRGPLTAARLALHALARGGDRRSGEPTVAALDLELCRATLALGDLAAARAGRRPATRAETVDVAELIATAAPSWRALGALFDATVYVERVATAPAPLVRIERLRLAQALGNVIANAAEHGGGRVDVQLVVSGGRVRILVADDGPGLPAPPATLGRPLSDGRRTIMPGRAGSVLGPLATTWRRRRGVASRGRGLAIALECVEQAGGALRALPSASGARLAIELPLVGAGALVSDVGGGLGTAFDGAAEGPRAPRGHGEVAR